MGELEKGQGGRHLLQVQVDTNGILIILTGRYIFNQRLKSFSITSKEEACKEKVILIYN